MENHIHAMTDDDRTRIDAAIARAQEGTTATLALHVILDAQADALERAKAEFLGRGLDRHERANAALILFAPNARTFAVIGDRALHEAVGQTFWDETAALMATSFKDGRQTDGLVLGIDRLGRAFHEHFKA